MVRELHNYLKYRHNWQKQIFNLCTIVLERLNKFF